MKLLNLLAQNGYRIFCLAQVLTFIKQAGYSENYAKKILHKMAKRGELQALGKGIYALPTELLAGGPIHSFELALTLAKKGAISYRSALGFHGLSDQVLKSVYVKIPKCQDANLSIKNDYHFGGIDIIVRRVLLNDFWGNQQAFIGEAVILITDLERTLLDGLSSPHLCGGFQEVMESFRRAYEKIDTHKLYTYTQRRHKVISKRLGWILDKLGYFPELQEILETIPIRTVQKLNPMAERRGHINKRWQLWENI